MNFYLAMLNVVHFAFWTYGILIFARVVSSWFPNANRYSIVRLIGKVVDPYLNLFKRFIPPIGGTVDISAIVAFFALQLLERFILWLLY